MYSHSWLIIRDDSKRTFEICGKESNTNHFTNEIHGMQKAGMAITGLTEPVTGKNSSKAVIKITGYTKEDGLYERLLREYRQMTRKSFDQWEE